MSYLTSGSVVDEITANQKMVLIQDSAPTNAYSGQVWTCTSSDPPLVKIYDAKNSQWMERREVTYRSGVNLFKPLLGSPKTLNGHLSIQHDTASGVTYLYFKSNSAWYGLVEA